MIAPHYDEQSGRALLYALLVECGEVSGHLADASEVTVADGSIGYAPLVRIHGRVEWTGRPIWIGPDGEEREQARRLALDRARAQAIDELCGLAARLPDWPETLCRFRRQPTNPTLNPITQEKAPPK